MRAAPVRGATTLVVADVPEPPAPTGDQLLVRVDAASTNGTDLGMRGTGPAAAVVRRLGDLGFEWRGRFSPAGPR